MRKAVFLDRDGTVIEECHYLKEPGQVKLLPGVIRGINLLKANVFLIVIVTNQSGIARGIFDLESLEQVNKEVTKQLAADGVIIDGLYFCPHHPEGIVPPFNTYCQCRKPETAMALQAEKELNISLRDSYMIGDKEIDISFGNKFGAKASILVATGYGKEISDTKADYRAVNFWDAATWILKNESQKIDY